MSTYSRVRASGLANRTPCQPSETCGPQTPSPSRNRPPDSASRVAAVIAVIAGVRAGICITALPTSIVVVRAATQASTRDRVRPVRLGGPGHRVAEPLGGLGQVQVLVASVPAPQ